MRLVTSLLAMSLHGRGEVGGCTLRVRTAWLSGLGYRQHLVGFGWAVSLLFCMNGLRKLVSSCKASSSRK